MPLPVIADVFRCSLEWTLNAGATTPDAVNVIHVKSATLDAAGVWGAWDANVTQAMWDWATGSVSVDRVAVTPLDGVSATYVGTTGRPSKWTGGGGSSSYLPQVSGVVKNLTARRGKSYQGRVFVPFVQEGEVTNGNLIDVAAVEAAWNAFAVAMAGDDATVGVASYLHSSFEPNISFVAETPTATQRRRMERRR